MDPAWLFRKCIGGPSFFGNKVQPLRFHSLMDGNATRVVVEQWLNHLHSPWAQMKPSIEKFKLKILFNTNLMPNLPTMYIYTVKQLYMLCKHIYHYICMHYMFYTNIIPLIPSRHGTSGLIVKCISTKGTSSRLTARLAASKGSVMLLPWYARKWTMNENVGFFLWKEMNIFPIVVLVLHSFTRTHLWISISCISIYLYIVH